MKRIINGVAATLLVACGGGGLAAQQAIPDTPAGQRTTALLETLGQTGEATVRAFVENNLNEQFRSMPMDQHLQVFARMRQDLRTAEIVSLTSSSPHQLELGLAGNDGRARIFLSVEPSPPHLISGLRIQPERAQPAGSGTLPEPARVSMDATARAQAVENVARVVEQNYLSPDTAALIAAHLRRQQSSGAYGDLTTFPDLARTLSRDLQAINGDRHLNVRFEAAGGPQPGPRRVSPGEAGRPAASGIERVERLVGNVGYLKLSIVAGSEAFSAVTEALRSLADTDAMILDLRGVPGGSAQMANFLISHFTPPEVLSLSVHTPATDETVHRYTLAEVPGPRRTEVPLYVLTDGGSASAAEDIPFVLQNLGRAKIVGERTAGAGRNNRFIPAGDGLLVSVSVTRVTDPRSGREWERVGIQPDLAVASEQALAAAHRDALSVILQHTRDSRRRRDLQRALQDLQGSQAGRL
jgi:retinol-binding protein 3